MAKKPVPLNGGKDYFSSYFYELRKSKLLSPKDEREVFQRNEKYIVSILCELMSLTEAWSEVDRILDEMIETAEIPTEFFDITKAHYANLEKKTYKKVRIELARKIKLALTKMINLYKIAKILEKMGQYKKAEKKFSEIAVLKNQIGVTLELIHHVKRHIHEWYHNELRRDPLSPMKNKEIIKAEEVLRRVSDLSKKLTKETNTIFSSNLRLAVTVARKYNMQNTELMDFIQEGNMAIAKAIEKFDWRRGTKFSTYAVPWMQQIIMKAMNDGFHPFRVPGHIVEIINKVTKATRNFFQTNGREPHISELSRILKISREKIEFVMKISKEPLVLESCYLNQDEDRYKLDDLISDPDSLSNDEVLDSIEKLNKIKNIRHIMKKVLSPREIKILELRCGLIYSREATLDEISEILNITRERVRQLERQAIRKLKKALFGIKQAILPPTIKAKR